MEFLITSKEFSSDYLMKFLKNAPELDLSSVQLIPKNQERDTRMLDPIILVAIIQATGTVLAASIEPLITRLLDFLKEKKKEKIIIKTSDGKEIEVRYDCPKEIIKECIEKIKDFESVKIGM